jgi:hypothetical protein
MAEQTYVFVRRRFLSREEIEQEVAETPDEFELNIPSPTGSG